jgi:murein L,D-transpeptidase YafK
MKQLLVIVLSVSVLAVLYCVYPHQTLPQGTKIDKLDVFKSQREMLVYSQGKLVKTYPISLGGQPIGSKRCQGDQKTPEGVYNINGKNPNSICYKNLGISYPNNKDLNNEESKCQDKGGDIKIHGLFNGYGFLGRFQRWTDWTDGCIAVTNEEMEELYQAVNVGATIEIHP